MDKLNEYRNVVKRVLNSYHELNIRACDTKNESALVFDSDHDHYLLLIMGWQGDKRIKNVMIHLRLKCGKIWIEEDWTEDGVATDLLQAGVPHDDIVLAFHPPHLRHYTEFASA
jgi:XisI protein